MSLRVATQGSSWRRHHAGRRRRPPTVAVAAAVPVATSSAVRRRAPSGVAAALSRDRGFGASRPQDDDDSDFDEDEDEEDDALFLAALADVDAEEAEARAGQEQQEEAEEEEAPPPSGSDSSAADLALADDADDDGADDLAAALSGDPYLFSDFGIEQSADESDEDEEERDQAQRAGGRGQRRRRRNKADGASANPPPPRPPSRAPSLRQLADAVLAADATTASSKALSSLSSGEIVRALGAWARLCGRREAPVGDVSSSSSSSSSSLTPRALSALRLLLLAAAERPLTPGQAAGALRAAAQCAAAPAAGMGGSGDQQQQQQQQQQRDSDDASPSTVVVVAAAIPWPALAVLFGKLLIAAPPPFTAAHQPPTKLRPDLSARAACEALWAAGALHSRLSQDAAARRDAERQAALAPPPPPPRVSRASSSRDAGPTPGRQQQQQQQQKQRQPLRRRGRSPNPPAVRPGEDARSELGRLFLREDGVAGTLPPAPPSAGRGGGDAGAGGGGIVPLVRSEAQDHALAVEASARAAAAAATAAAALSSSSSSSSSSFAPSPLPGLPPEVLLPACRLCDAFVVACEAEPGGASAWLGGPRSVPLPELAAAAAAVARLQRPPGALFAAVEARLCAEGGLELASAATRDLTTIAWAAGTAAEDAVARGEAAARGSSPAAFSSSSSSASSRRRLDAPLPSVARAAQSAAPRSLMACIASECRRRLVLDAEVATRFVAAAEGAIAAREQRARGVVRWADGEAAAQLRDAELPAARSRLQAEWIGELDEFLRREGVTAESAASSSAARPRPRQAAPPPPLPPLSLDVPPDLLPDSSGTPRDVSPRLALFPGEGEHHLRPGGLMDRLAAADAARSAARAAAEHPAASSSWRPLPAERRIGPAEAAALLVASARAAYLDDELVDACLRAHGDAWIRAAATGAGTWPLRAAARPPRASARQRGALARVAWALALLGRCPAHDEDALLRHAADALAGTEAGTLSALPGDVLDLTRALAAGKVRLAAPMLRRWAARGVARAVAEGAGLGVVAAAAAAAAAAAQQQQRTDATAIPPPVVLPTPADALLPDAVAALALAAARLPRGAGAAAWAVPTALAAVSPWLAPAAPLCSPSGLADLAEAYALDGRPADDGGGGLAPVVEAAAARLTDFDAPTLARLLRSLLARSDEARRQRREVTRRRARLARDEGMDHFADDDGGRAYAGLGPRRRGAGDDRNDDQDDDDDDDDEEQTRLAAAAERAAVDALGPASAPLARDHALECLPWRLRQRLRGSAAAPGRALLRAQGALPPALGRAALADAPYLPADASDAGVEARWRALRAFVGDEGGGGGSDVGLLDAAAFPDLRPLFCAADERLRPLALARAETQSGGGGGGGGGSIKPLLGRALALDLLQAMSPDYAGAAPSDSAVTRCDYDRDRLAAWLAREVGAAAAAVASSSSSSLAAPAKARRSLAATAALRRAWASGARLPAQVAAPLARDAAAWTGLGAADAVDAAWALVRMGCCCCSSEAPAAGGDGGDAHDADTATAAASASASVLRLLHGAARRVEREAASAALLPASLPARLLYCWRETMRGREEGKEEEGAAADGAAAPLPPAVVALALRRLPQTPPEALCWLMVALGGGGGERTTEESELLRLAARELKGRRPQGVVERRVGAPLLLAARRAAATVAAGRTV